MMRTICTGTAVLALLLAAHGPLSAQEPPAAGQSPQPPAGASESEFDEGLGWGDWQGNMMGEHPGWDWHEHMMAEHPGLDLDEHMMAEHPGWWDRVDHWGPGHMMGWRGGRGPGAMWGGGPPMHSGMMPMMMMAMIDTDENGSISYEEIEVVHQRMFNLADKDENGELSPEEVQEAMGWGFGRQRPPR